MSELNCERVCMEAMAQADGHQSEVSPEQIEAHLADCPDCRREINQLRALAGLLAGQRQRRRNEHIWTSIEGGLPDAARARGTSRAWLPFAALGLLLVGYKILEMITDRDFGLLFKLAPILFIIAAFGYLEENPFKINAELRLEGGD